MATYYHGGRAGIQRGAFLLPPDITKARSCAEFGAAGICRTDRVYITTSLAAAVLFSAGSRNGQVYEVEPIGAVEQDPDCLLPGLSYQVAKARVLKIIKVSEKQRAAATAALLEGEDAP